MAAVARGGDVIMGKYSVKTRFVFEGEFILEAESADRAKEYVDQYCGAVGLKNIESPQEVDFEFPMHPEKIIGKVGKVKRFFFYWTDSVSGKGTRLFVDTADQRDSILSHYFEASLCQIDGVDYPRRSVRYQGVIR
jgi:hypothetical protein